MELQAVPKNDKRNLRLYFWHNLILEGERYTIYSIAKNLSDAKKIAIDKAPNAIKEKLKNYLNDPNSIVLKFNQPSSFIYKSYF